MADMHMPGARFELVTFALRRSDCSKFMATLIPAISILVMNDLSSFNYVPAIAACDPHVKYRAMNVRVVATAGWQINLGHSAHIL
jgi:hypothetical protein